MGECMTLGAVRAFPHPLVVDRAAADVLAGRHHLQVSDVDAAPIAAQVVKLHPSGDVSARGGNVGDPVGLHSVSVRQQHRPIAAVVGERPQDAVAVLLNSGVPRWRCHHVRTDGRIKRDEAHSPHRNMLWINTN